MANTNTYSATAPALGSISVEQVEPASIDSVWPECANAIGAALVRYMPGLLTVEDCRLLCKQSQNQLWIASARDRIVGCAISELTMHPRGMAARIFLSSYSDPWSPYLTNAIERWADSLGVATIVVLGPPRMGHVLGTPVDVVTYWRALSGPLRIDREALAPEMALH
jgi:hypothetical protein